MESADLESTRLDAVRATGLLDGAAPAELERVVRLVTRALGVPVALVSLVDAERQVFAAQVGLAEPWASRRETPLSHSFCRRVVDDRSPLVVDDARTHPGLSSSPAIDELGVVAYAGVLIRDANGVPLGALCAIDTAPRRWEPREIALLEELAEAVSAHLQLRLALGELALEQAHGRNVRRVLELLITETSLPVVLTALVGAIEAALPGVRASVLLMNSDGAHLRNGASPSLPPEYVRALENMPIGPSEGSCGTAAYTNRQTVVSDVATDPLWDEYRTLALPHGLRACWSTPIAHATGEVLGTFAAYLGEPRAPTTAELERIEEARALALTVIDRFRADTVLRARSDENQRLARVEAGRREIATAIARQERLDVILDRIAAEACAESGAQTSLIAAHSDHPDLAGMTSLPITAGTVDWGVLAVGAGGEVSQLATLAELAGVALLAAFGREQLERDANSDPLTGVGNRRLFDRALATGLQTGGPIALLLVDLDGFKAVNDSLGHDAGDRVLCGIAEVLNLERRPRDLAARIGGDEFALLLLDTAATGAQAAAHRIRTAVERGGPDLAGVSVSVGVASSEPGDDAASLRRRADAALYANKRAAGAD